MSADPIPPPMGTCGADLYEAMRPFAGDRYEVDAANGWVLAHLCEAIGRMRQAVSDLVRDSDDGPGWSPLTDVDRAPGADQEIDGLPFVAQLAGVQLTPGLNDTDRRAAILRRDGFHRGRPDAIVSFAERYTDGTPGAVQIRERYNPALGLGVDAPYYGRIIIKRSRLLPGVDTVDLARRVLARVPAGLIYDVLITDDLDWDEVRAAYSNWDDARARTTDWADLLRG